MAQNAKTTKSGTTMAKAVSMVLFILSLPFLCCSCKAQPEVVHGSPGVASFGGDSLCVATWNVQNIFDDVDDGGEYDEYTKAGGWSTQAFQRRLDGASEVLSHLPSCGDCIVVLNEVENANVVSCLASMTRPGGCVLPWFAFAKASGAAMGLAVMSSMPIVDARVHGVGEGLRPVLEVSVETSLGLVSVLAVHFKSNVGGVEETAPFRRLAGEVVSQVAASILRDNPGRLVLVCGDFNEECWDGNSIGRGLDSTAALKVSGSFGRGVWYCQWLDDSAMAWPNGSYCYGDVWRCYDNILVSSAGCDGSGYELKGSGVVFSGSIRGVDDKPNSWKRSLLKGVSDHLPVWVVLDVCP